MNGDGRKELIARAGEQVTVFDVCEDEFSEIWSVYLPSPYDPGVFIFNDTSWDMNWTPLMEDPLAAVRQGELVTGDLNSDGFIDLLSYADGLRVLAGDGRGGFYPYYFVDPRFPAFDAEIADLDGDGDNDIVASSGNQIRIYLQGETSPAVIELTPQGIVTTIAGERLQGGASEFDIVDSALQKPQSAAARDGYVFVSDIEANRVLQRTPDGIWSPVQDSSGAELEFLYPTGLYFDGDRLWICDTGNHRVMLYTPSTKTLIPFAGNGLEGNSADDVTAIEASLNLPSDVTALPDSNILIADAGNNDLRIVDPFTGIMSRYFPETFPADLDTPIHIAADDLDSVYVLDQNGARVRRFSPEGDSWTVNLLIGGGHGRDDSSTAADNSIDSELLFAEGFGMTPDGQILVADTGNQRILSWKDDKIAWFAGSGVPGYQVDGFPLNVFHLQAPRDIEPISDTEFLVADGNSLRLLQLGPELESLPEPLEEIPMPTPTGTPVSVPSWLMH